MRERLKFEGGAMKFLLGLFLVLVATNAMAKGKCISKSEMQAIAEHFGQYEDLAKQDEYCLDDSDDSRLIEALSYMRNLKFEEQMTPSKDELFSGRFAGNWFDYFVKRINEFQVDERCAKGVGAYVYFIMPTMFACKLVLTDSFTYLDRVSIFMHEARHIDGFPHVQCSAGPRKGMDGACDERISDGGSYAVTVETYAQFSRYAADAHPALKAYAAASAVTYADAAFSEPVSVDRSPSVLVLANDRQFYKLSTDTTSLGKLGLAPELGKIVMRSQRMILFPSKLENDARYVFARGEGEIAQQAGNIAQEYNERKPAERALLVDAHMGAQWSARVYKDKVRMECNPGMNDVTELSLGGEEAVSLLYLNGYSSGTRNIQLITRSGKLFELGCSEEFVGSLEVSKRVLDRQFKRVYKVGELVAGLGADGSLYDIKGESSKAISLPGLDGRITEIAPQESFRFFDER